MKILTDKLNDTLEFAKSINDTSLQECFDRLSKVDEVEGTETTITDDFAPKSFYFSRMKNGEFRSNGGIIYHGRHDNGGDGGTPTFSVNLTPFNGWSIHT